jgi:tripartite-type tricarboxylate transporter receptor subunit TctC
MFATRLSSFSCLRILILVASSPAHGTYAQPEVPYPTQLVRIVVPFSAGSTSDLLARTISDRLSTRWQQQIIVENRPGIAGTASVAKAQPDGYTIIMASNGHAILDRISASLPLIRSDFVGISEVGTLPLVLVVPPNSPQPHCWTLLTARAAPGKMSYASAGLGSTTYMAGELLKRIAKIDVLHVPYRGAPDAHTSVMRGDTQMCFTPVSVGAELIQTGRVRALAVSGTLRSHALLNVPTFAEAGVADFAFEAWFGLLAPHPPRRRR